MDGLSTERLTGSRVTADDIGAIRSIFSDPRVSPTLTPDGQPASSERVREIRDTWLAHWRRHGFGTLMFRTRNGTFVGYCGLWRREIGGEDVTELAYSVHPDHWGRGYATEMGAALLAAGRERGLFPVTAVTLPHNARSRRVMEKLGLSYEKDVPHAGLVHVLYRIR